MTDHLSASVGRKEKETEPMHFVFRVWGSEGAPAVRRGEQPRPESSPGSRVKEDAEGASQAEV